MNEYKLAQKNALTAGSVPVLQLSTALMGRFFYDYFMAGSVAMYCRQQRYPPPRLISYKITGIGGLWGYLVPLSELSFTPCAGSKSGA